MWKAVKESPGDLIKTLNLTGMKVNCHPPVGAGDFNHIRQQTGRDRHPRLVLLVTLGVGQVGRHERYSPGRITVETVDGDERFHDIVVYWTGMALDEVNVLTADANIELNPQVFIGKLYDFPWAHGHIRGSQRFL